MLAVHAGLEQELLDRLWDRMDNALGSLVATVEEHEPVLYRERGEFELSRDIFGGHLHRWSELQTDAPDELRQIARDLAQFTMARRALLTDVDQLRRELQLPPRVGRPFGPRQAFDPLPTREGFLAEVDAAWKSLRAQGRRVDQLALAELWNVDERRVRELFDYFGVDWVEYRRARRMQERD